MNIIQNQADDFIQLNLSDTGNYKEFIDDTRRELWEYKKDVYKIVFVERIIQATKIKYDKHLLKCTNLKSCSKNKYYENTLFFLQEELDELESNVKPEDFNKGERIKINETLEQILADLSHLKVGQELTYNDLSDEFEELKDLYFLNKRNWLQLFQGKVTEMVAGGVISETVSKSIVEVLAENYDKLIQG